MTITIPQWPFVAIAWAGLLLVFLAFIGLVVNYLIYLMKNRKIWRVAKVWLTAEKWRKDAKEYSMSTFEDVVRIWYKDSPQDFEHMRWRILYMTAEPPTPTAIADEMQRVSDMAATAGFVGASYTLACMADRIRLSTPE